MTRRTFISWNVNGLRSIEKKGFIAWLERSGSDLVSLQETRVARETVLDEALKKPRGYTPFWDYSERKGYSGVASYVKNTFLPKWAKTDFGKNILSAEGRMLELEYPEFIFFNVYFPNGGASDTRLQYKLEFYKHFLAYLKALKKRGQSIIFCGDLNTAHKEIDLARPKENIENSGFMPIEREWLDRFAAEGFVDTFRTFRQEGGQYSWWDQYTHARERNVGWRIDYFWVSDDLVPQVKDGFIHQDVFGSDHAPVGMVIEL